MSYISEELLQYNRYGECAAEDVRAIVQRIQALVKRRGAVLALQPTMLVHQILSFLSLRQRCSIYDISDPPNECQIPTEWTAAEERLWNDWIYTMFPVESWLAEVMDPVLGTIPRLWEGGCEGWRTELVHFLPWWIQRSVAIVTKFDPTFMEPAEEQEDSKRKEIDPYLLEHGNSKQRRGR
jgi:hypothetical protein